MAACSVDDGHTKGSRWPLVGKRYRLHLPDGRTVAGTINGSGRLYCPDVPKGTACFWILPDKGDPIEAAGKTTVAVRMKRAGARFSQHGGQTVRVHIHPGR